MSSNRLTYQELSEKTGVSVATISRVLSGSGGVKEDTKTALLEQIAKLGYTVDDFAVREKKHGGGVIIFNLPALDNPFYAEIIAGAKTAAVQRGYQMLVNEEHINESTIDGFIAMLKTTQAAGLILTNHVAPALLKRIDETVCMVQCCEYDKSFDIPFVSIDDAAAARSAMQHLFSLGRKKIAFINGPIRYKYARERLKGYHESLEAAGIQADDALIINLTEINYNLAVSTATGLFQQGPRPDAFFCVSDVFAAAVIKAAHRLHISVPGDILVVGFDNVPISSMTSPAITTISQPCDKIGFSACELLVERMTHSTNLLRHILYETELIVRESTALGSGGP